MLENLHKSKTSLEIVKIEGVQKDLTLFKVQTSQDVVKRDPLGITPMALRKYRLVLTKSQSFYMAAYKARKDNLVFPKLKRETTFGISSAVHSCLTRRSSSKLIEFNLLKGG
ncbi:hypothetical protein TNCV_3962521 [Trichonephila clavipes]|nr:hypothetical protein TNCV_3962521 [Trichonephila clavipes]